MTAAASPFPFDALPVVSRAEIRAARDLRRAASLVRAADVADALSELVDAPVEITAATASSLDGTTLPASALGVALTVDGAARGGSVLVSAEPGLAAVLVARGLRQRVPRVVDGGGPAAAATSGAFAALVHAALRRAHAGVPLRVVGAGPAAALAREIAEGGGQLGTRALAVTVGRDVFGAHVTINLDALPRSPAFAAAPWSHADLAAMGDAPLALGLVAATCLASRAELASLRPGDVLVVPAFPLRAAAESDDALTGPVSLVPFRGERGLTGRLAESARLVIRTERAATHRWDADADVEAEGPMSGEESATLEVLENAPVVVRVELGVVEMTAREWSALADGDVIALGRRLGDPVVLRVSGVELARGELVQVDGEYGVRLSRKK